MNKKMFALASITALAGLVASTAGAGCTTTTTTTAAPAPAPDAAAPKTDAGPKADAGPAEPVDEGDADTTCPSSKPFDRATAVYAAAAALELKCTAGELSAFSASIEAQSPDFDLISEDCKTCLTRPNSAINTKSGLINQAGCVELQTESKECGEATKWIFACLDTACKGCAKDDEQARSQCFENSQQTVCKAELDNLNSACPGGLQAANVALEACSSLDGIFRSFCFDGVEPPMDGGADGGDGGDGGM